MLKVYDHAITFAEFPDEIALCLNISNCPGGCTACSEPWLLNDVGEELTSQKLDSLIASNKNITLLGLMGGDSDHRDVARIANYIHTSYPHIKVGMYSGREFLDMELLNVLDVYKIGRWIVPTGPSSQWHKSTNGPLPFPWSNQLYFVKQLLPNGSSVWLNETKRFREKPFGNPENYIISPQEDNN